MSNIVPHINPAIWFWGLINGLLLVGLLVLVIIGIIVFLRQRDRAGAPSESSDRALTILRERFARGELTEEEYERMKRKLTE